MISQENVEIVRSLYGFWRDRDYSTLEEAVDPEAVLERVAKRVQPRHPSRHRRPASVYHADRRHLGELRVTPEEYIDAGDKVVVANRISGEGRGSGVETEMLLFAVVAFRDGKILRFTGGFRDRSEALEAAGIEE